MSLRNDIAPLRQCRKRQKQKDEKQSPHQCTIPVWIEQVRLAVVSDWQLTRSLANSTTTDPTSFNLTSLVALAQQWSLPIGFCELGGLAYPNGDGSAANVWIPNLVSYINSLPAAVPCAFAMLYDTNTSVGDTSNAEFTAPGANQPAVIAAWKAALGPGGTMR